MRVGLLCILSAIVLLLFCCSKAATLPGVLVGKWVLDHYEAYLNGNPSTAAGSLDQSIEFSSGGSCCWNGRSNFNYSVSGNTITLYNEKRRIDYKVTFFTERTLVMYFYAGEYKMVYYLEKF